MSIDEYARRKGHHYNTSIVDLDKGRPIATCKGRRADDVIAWFKCRPQAELDRVEVVVLDMSKTFFAARIVKKLMRPRTCSISGALRAVHGTGSGLYALRLD